MCRGNLRRFRNEAGAELLDLPYGPIPDPDTPAPVRFLPSWDATLLVHARRTGILPEEHRSVVLDTKNPNSVGTVLVDGRVAATWQWAEERIRVEPLISLDAETADQVEVEAERLVEFHR